MGRVHDGYGEYGCSSIDRNSFCVHAKTPSKNPLGSLRSLSSDNFLVTCCVHFFNCGFGACGNLLYRVRQFIISSACVIANSFQS